MWEIFPAHVRVSIRLYNLQRIVMQTNVCVTSFVDDVFRGHRSKLEIPHDQDELPAFKQSPLITKSCNITSWVEGFQI